MEKSVLIPVETLKAMQDTLIKGSGSPTLAAWACGAVYTAIENAIKKGEMEDENRNGV